MHLLDDPAVSPRVRALLASARRGPAMSPGRIRASVRGEDADGRDVAVPAEVVDAAVRFEERYGGLWYPLVGPNGMEHGLDGEPVVHTAREGWVVSGILDGDQTWPLGVLLDGRTVMTLAGVTRLVNRSVAQRIEGHAQLACVRSRPHVAFTVAARPGEEPAVEVSWLPPSDVAATGPADRWWADGGSAVHMQLHKWWGGEDLWVVRCFSAEEERLADLVAAVRRAVGDGVPREEWCALCGGFRGPLEPCLPQATWAPGVPGPSVGG